ncbi:MAG: sulfurtransferase [Methylobacter sp.]|nr:sulfurtransferase [Methylobacter sp.]
MAYNTLVSAATLNQHINNTNWIIIDCRFSLADTEAGVKAYRRGHIPHARYAHLDKDLSSGITAHTGRHPLPGFTALTKKLGDWGIANHSQVVVYDDAGGVFAARLWWLLYCLGHENAAVLNGGIKQWLKEGYKTTTTLPTSKTTTFRPYLNDELWVNAVQVQNNLAKKSICLIDARSAERFRGEEEPIDPIAGHIPGAVNRPFQLNLDANGLFLSGDDMYKQFKQIIGDKAPEHVVHMCGSGVTACHNVLAMEYAGLKGSKLYAGSWSEWIRNKNRAVSPHKQ